MHICVCNVMCVKTLIHNASIHRHLRRSIAGFPMLTLSIHVQGIETIAPAVAQPLPHRLITVRKKKTDEIHKLNL